MIEVHEPTNIMFWWSTAAVSSKKKVFIDCVLLGICHKKTIDLLKIN